MTKTLYVDLYSEDLDTHLIGCRVYGSQLSLVVQHLFKVRDMPELVSRVAMEPLY